MLQGVEPRDDFYAFQPVPLPQVTQVMPQNLYDY